MTNLVTIYGGSGFVGRQVAKQMAQAGWRVRVAVRRPNEALFVRTYGTPGQVEPVPCNIRDDASTRAAMRGAGVVVNCVGTLDWRGRNRFEAVQAEGAGRVARLAAAEGVSRLVHLSAIGADPAAPSHYGRSKAEGEARIRDAFPAAVILRPSAVFGPGDGLFERFASLSRLGPVMLLPHARSRLQPVYVEDVARAALLAATSDIAPGIIELGGPEVVTLRTILRRTLQVIERRRLVLSVPAGLMRVPAFAFDMVEAASLGLIRNRILTRDQIAMLARDNVVAAGARKLADLGIAPAAMEPILPEYLWRFRPSGQYAAIKASARNLKGA